MSMNIKFYLKNSIYATVTHEHLANGFTSEEITEALEKGWIDSLLDRKSDLWYRINKKVLEAPPTVTIPLHSEIVKTFAEGLYNDVVDVAKMADRFDSMGFSPESAALAEESLCKRFIEIVQTLLEKNDKQ